MKEQSRALPLKISALFGNLFERDDITEIIINRVGEIRYETKDGWQIGTDEENSRVTKDALEDFTNASAVFSSNSISTDKPILSADLPTGERLQVVIPPACDKNQYSITIRKPSKNNFSLKDFKDQGFLDEIKIGKSEDPSDKQLKIYLNDKDYYKFFDLAVSCGTKNIVIAGATGSGKTTFMKSLIQSIPENERLITIEDVREIYSDIHQNMVNLLYPSENHANISATILLKSCLRMKPDRILLAELRGGEAFDYINVISSGHGGSITSLHAGSHEEVIRRLTLMTLQNPTGGNIPYLTAESIIKSTIDIIAVITNHRGVRKISSLYWKDYIGE